MRAYREDRWVNQEGNRLEPGEEEGVSGVSGRKPELQLTIGIGFLCIGAGGLGLGRNGVREVLD